jgi:HSP20 family molecular chaperone IbpA
MHPTYWEKTKDGYMCLVHTLGIRPEEIKIEVEEDFIRLSAESKYEGLERPFTKNMDIPVDKDIMSNVVKVKYKTENGLTFIYLDVEHKENKIKIEQI